MNKNTERILGLVIVALLIITVATSMAISATHPSKPTEPSTTVISTEQPKVISTEPSTIEDTKDSRDLDLLAAVIYYEAGSSDCTDRHQQLVAQVVLNRVASSEFPNTVYDVITQTKPSVQYSPYRKIISIAGNKNIIPQRCYDNALMVLNGKVECPSNIVWQSNFRQGSGVYEVYKTSYSTTYFCYR